MMPHKGASTQSDNQQVLGKPHHHPSNRDQQAREKLKQKVKIKSRAYIQLGEEALQIVSSNIPTRHTGHSPFTGFSGWFNRFKFKFTSHIVCYTR